jgi:hypothetical protein
MPPPFTNTLQFTQTADITFNSTGNELKVFVKGILLGAINASYPVTMYVTVSNGIKSLTMTQISNTVYTQGNTNNPNTDTVYYNFNNRDRLPTVRGCTSSNTTFKMIGWDDTAMGQVCVGVNGYTNVFNISTNCAFKAKIEQVQINNQPQLCMVVRYSGNVFLNVNQSIADCFNTPYCYYCDLP